MKTTQIAILGLALASAGGAGFIALNMNAPQQVVEVQPTIQTEVSSEEVLVATADIPLGDEITTQVGWQPWPNSGVAEGFITKTAEPNALEEISGSVARSPILRGEPIRRAKLVGAGQSFMSSILPPGKRAVATQVAADTSAGGFILPNDFVDVIMTRRQTSTTGGGETFSTETVLKNVRVLAVDQTIREDENGQRVIVGETATLELTSEQAEILTVAQQMADRLTLALRSIADAREDVAAEDAAHLVNGGGKGVVRMIKSGIVSETQGASQ